jgi:hypothetical protein
MHDEHDVGSIDGIVAALYEEISGPAGERNWDRERTLFLPGARLVPGRSTLGIAPPAGTDLESYIASRAPYFAEHGIWETEIAREVFEFGGFAHVLSSYVARHTPDGPPFMRGINSLQLTHDGRRWWIVSLVWDNERPGLAVPERLAGTTH